MSRTLCRCTVCKAIEPCSVCIPVHFGNPQDISSALVCDTCFWRFTLSGAVSRPLDPEENPRALSNVLRER